MAENVLTHCICKISDLHRFTSDEILFIKNNLTAIVPIINTTLRVNAISLNKLKA